LRERKVNCVEVKAGGLDLRRAAWRPRRPAGKGAAAAFLAFLMAPATAQGAGQSTEMTVAPPHATAEHTLISLGIVALNIETRSIVLSAADGPAVPLASSFAAARSSGAFAVTGNATATLSLTLGLGDALADGSGRIPLPLGGGWARNARAALSLGADGKLSLDIGSSFEFSSSSFGFSSSSSGPDRPSGRLTFGTNVLNPWKRTTLGWRYTF
jgi:hypothetical protein